VIGICCWGVAVEISQTASVTALEPVQGPMQCKDEGLVWRSLSDTVALCQLTLSFKTGLDIARPPRVKKGSDELKDLLDDLRLVDEAVDAPFEFPQGGELVEPHLSRAFGTSKGGLFHKLFG
jgi:hypothetical protein